MRERALSRKALFGLLQLTPNLSLLEAAKHSGYDFLFLDGEHGAFGEDDFRATLHSLANSRMLSLVRLRGHDSQALARYVGMGADAILVPHISTVEEAIGMSRAMSMQNRSAALIVILESRLGASNAERILALQGIDGAIVGPNDLTADLGRQGAYEEPAYADALALIERAATQTGKLLGTVPHGSYSIQSLLARGHQLIILGTDQALIRTAMSAQLTEARSFLMSLG